ncbi:hypothetical protein AAEO56_09175 [Flavobacterium sp. DGU11]|uniref:DUF4274 domain-containing protein n=1 Tax=Flavobacterium arundinis TaxID=3139143 RepID=A0ABU9HW86_9FLAO
MRTLEELAEKEQYLLSNIDSVQGTMEEKYHLLKEAGVFDQFKNIHVHYAAMCGKDLEALKRAVFLMWYSRVEPAFLSGINELDLDSVSKTMESLNDCLKNSIIDSELEWMINYYSNWGYLFEDFKHLDSINEFLLKEPEESKLPLSINQDIMKNRGQMGRYWNSLNRFE